MESGVPTQRWQRKAMEQGVQRLALPKDAANSSLLSLSNLSLSTPVLSSGSSARASPARASPGRLGAARSPSRSCSTPSLGPPLGPGASASVLDGSLSLRPASGGRTPTRGLGVTGAARTPGGDRFIPCRSATDLENSYNTLMRAHDQQTCDDNNNNSYSAEQYQRQLLRDTLLNAGMNDSASSASSTAALSSSAAASQLPSQQQQQQPESRVLCFRARAPPRPAAAGYTNQLRVLYSASKAGSAASRAPSSRYIPAAPERVLDAPELLDDYYLHLLDWSGGNQLAVALGAAVYVWTADAGDIVCLTQLEDGLYVSAVAWVGGGAETGDGAAGGSGSTVLAIGDSSGCVQLWDVSRRQRLRRMPGHRDRVGAMSWNAHIVTSGSRAGDVHHHDVRVASYHVGSFTSHVQEVCGVRWSPDGRLLATGGNDNQLLVWDSLAGLGSAAAEPLHVLNQHQAAVKALAWCPWSSHLLASGGGTADRTIRLWSGSTGQLFNTVTTNSQVSALLWSTQYKEILSGHGFSFNQLTLWKYPQMERIVDLTGHESRVLEMVLSPDGTTVASAAGDETIRLWKCWETDKTKKAKSARPVAKSALKLQSIR